MVKNIVVFGAGKSSTYLIEYLSGILVSHNLNLILVDANEAAALEKLQNSPNTKGIGLDVKNDLERKAQIEIADLVISMLPPALHYLVALDCLEFGKNLLTASYTDSTLTRLAPQIKEKGLLFLCEMGLDPGIDHMSAMKLIHQLRSEGATITSFRSHCGGLVAPESDDNPWRYKVSWNPRNVVLAGKTGAVYREKGDLRVLNYEQLFDPLRRVNIPG
ncbi:MAG TPA: saccharopine dehydrogenase C-terminal domain-containing protein, partial [Flavitalea sp.]|nr:saccharopine dehydrogenase C-terminal domain-containing protein [Flavitalea sp.]